MLGARQDRRRQMRRRGRLGHPRRPRVHQEEQRAGELHGLQDVRQRVRRNVRRLASLIGSARQRRARISSAHSAIVHRAPRRRHGRSSNQDGRPDLAGEPSRVLDSRLQRPERVRCGKGGGHGRSRLTTTGRCSGAVPVGRTRRRASERDRLSRSRARWPRRVRSRRVAGGRGRGLERSRARPRVRRGPVPDVQGTSRARDDAPRDARRPERGRAGLRAFAYAAAPRPAHPWPPRRRPAHDVLVSQYPDQAAQARPRELDGGSRRCPSRRCASAASISAGQRRRDPRAPRGTTAGMARAPTSSDRARRIPDDAAMERIRRPARVPFRQAFRTRAPRRSARRRRRP